MDGAHEADRVSEVGTEKQQVAAALGDSVDNGLEVIGGQRIGGLVDNPEALLLGVRLRAEYRIAREFSVR